MTKTRNKNQTVSRSQASVRTDTCLQIICIKFEFLHQISKFSFSNTDCFWPLKVHFMASRTSPPPHLQLVFFFFKWNAPSHQFHFFSYERTIRWMSLDRMFSTSFITDGENSLFPASNRDALQQSGMWSCKLRKPNYATLSLIWSYLLPSRARLEAGSESEPVLFRLRMGAGGC